MENFEVIIASPPDRKKLVAEIWFCSKQLLEISQEHGPFKIELFENKNLLVDLESFKEILNYASKQLTNGNTSK